jgi:hypothetical protein
MDRRRIISQRIGHDSRDQISIHHHADDLSRQSLHGASESNSYAVVRVGRESKQDANGPRRVDLAEREHGQGPKFCFAPERRLSFSLRRLSLSSCH